MRVAVKVGAAFAVASLVVVGAAAVPAAARPAGAARPAVRAGAAAAHPYRTPVSTFKVGDPGIIYDGGRFVSFYTAFRGGVATAPNANGPWVHTSRTALTTDPAWAVKPTKKAPHPSYWAPAAIKVGTSDYVIFYAAVRKNSTYARCIGVGYATKAAGPYTPGPRPISCINGQYGAPDVMKGAAANDSVIDPTPRFLTVKGKRGLYLTYKTQHSVGKKGQPGFHYYSTIRMVQVNTGSSLKKGVKIVGTSHILTVRPDNIEENPVMVQRGKVFTLFTSLGGYTLCSYHTEYRTSTNPWKWGASKRLPFPASVAHNPKNPKAARTAVCGTGDGDVYYDPEAKGWRIFWSGRLDGPGKDFYLYVGVVSWKNTHPSVTAVLNRHA